MFKPLRGLRAVGLIVAVVFMGACLVPSISFADDQNDQKKGAAIVPEAGAAGAGAAAATGAAAGAGAAAGIGAGTIALTVAGVAAVAAGVAAASGGGGSSGGFVTPTTHH